MRHVPYVFLGALLTFGILTGVSAWKPEPQLEAAKGRVGPAYLYPNPQLTTGKADTLDRAALIQSYSDHCPSGKPACTYSQDHRNVPAHDHLAVYDEYSVPPAGRNIQAGEVDHYYPLCAGGSNDLTNLWYMPATNTWNGVNYGYHEKDNLETWVCARIRANQLEPQEAFTKLTTDWVAYYLEVKPGNYQVTN